MANKSNNQGNKTPCFGCVALLLALTHSTLAWSGDLRFKPLISVNGRYSDNIALSAVNRQSSFMTEVLPGFALSSKGARGDFSVDYGLQSLMYSHDSSANTLNNQLSARLKSDWLDDRFVINADARIGQQTTNSTAATGIGNYNLTNNRSQTRSASITPSWKSRFGKDATFDARWQLTYADTDNALQAATIGSNLDLTLTSGSAFNKIPWSLAYHRHATDASTANGNQTSSFSGSLGYIYSPKTRFILTLGTNSNNGTTSSYNQLSGTFWNLGANWAPTGRTSLNVTAGERHNGSSYGLDFTHRTRRSTWGLRYSEEIMDTFGLLTASGAFDIYDCGGFPKIVAAGSAAPDSNECGGITPVLMLPAYPLTYPQPYNSYTLSKTWSGVTTYKTGKSLFSLALHRSRRELLATNSIDDNSGYTGTWTLRLGPRLSSTLSTSASHAETTLSQSDDWNLAWLLTYQMSRHSSGILELRRLERDPGSTTGAYKENSVSARVNMSF